MRVYRGTENGLVPWLIGCLHSTLRMHGQIAIEVGREGLTKCEIKRGQWQLVAGRGRKMSFSGSSRSSALEHVGHYPAHILS